MVSGKSAQLLTYCLMIFGEKHGARLNHIQ